MNWKQIGFGLVLADFAAFTGWVVWQYGYVGLLTAATQNAAGWQVAIDLVIACTVGMYWIWTDARARRVTPWPYLVATVFLGSIGLLAYVVRRARLAERGAAPSLAHAARA